MQLRPVLARNICCTISWTMFLLRLRTALLKCNLPNYLRLRPVLAHYRRCCTMPRRRYYLQSCSLYFSKYVLLHISKYGLFHISKDGLKAQKEYSPEQRSGYSWPSILRSERAKGIRKCADYKRFYWCMGMDSFSFCAYSAPVCLYIFTQSVALGCIPIGASPRLRSFICCTMFWLCAVAYSLRNLYADCLLWFRLSNLLNTGFYYLL